MVLDIDKQLKRILKGRDLTHSKLILIESHSDLLYDVYDGEIYRRFLNDNLESIRDGSTFSFSLNADGIALCEKSDLSITPIILVLNEIHIGERFCIENVVVAGNYNSVSNKIFLSSNFFYYQGLIISYGKASMYTFFDSLNSKLIALEYGIDIENMDSTSRSCCLFLLLAVFDKPARASCLNLVNSTGFFSCLKCRQKGRTIKTRSSFVL